MPPRQTGKTSALLDALNAGGRYRAAYVNVEIGQSAREDVGAAFQTFFREHSEHWLRRFQYQEAGPQLLLQAFLQRIVNSGGRIEREYALGRMRTDLLVLWPAHGAPGDATKTVVECKCLHGSLDRTIDRASPRPGRTCRGAPHKRAISSSSTARPASPGRRRCSGARRLPTARQSRSGGCRRCRTGIDWTRVGPTDSGRAPKGFSGARP